MAYVPDLNLDALKGMLAGWVIEARADLEDQLAVARSERAMLVRAGEANEARLGTMEADLSACTNQCHQLQGQLLERAADVERLQMKHADDVQRLRAELLESAARADALELALMNAQVIAQEAVGRTEEIRASLERQLACADAERTAAYQAEDASKQCLVEAEKAALVADARLEGERSKSAALGKRIDDLIATVARLEPEALRAAEAGGKATALVQVIERQDAMRLSSGLFLTLT